MIKIIIIFLFVFFGLLDWAILAGSARYFDEDDDDKAHSGLLTDD